MARMLLATHGTNGDVLPFIALGKALQQRGHSVLLLTHAHYCSTAAEAGLECIAIDTPEEYERQLDDSHLLMNPLRDPQALIAFYQRNRQFEQMRAEYDLFAANAVPGETVLVARHTSGLAGLFAAEALGLPLAWVALSPSQIMTLPVTTYVYGHILADGINQLRASLGLTPVTDWAGWLNRPNLQLGLWPEWFAPAEPHWPTSLRSSGFVLHDQAEDGALPAEVEALLRQHRHMVLISGGTGQLLHASFYQTAVAACERAGLPALLVTRHQELLPQPLPPNIHWFPSLPFRALMPHVGVVLHHGGMGTLARALWAGVPQLILADGADRPDNAARLERLGLAAWAAPEAWSPASIATQLLGLCMPEARQRSAHYQQQIDPAQALGQACQALEHMLGAHVENVPNQQPPIAAADTLRERLRGLSPAQRAALGQRLRSAQPSPSLPATIEESR